MTLTLQQRDNYAYADVCVCVCLSIYVFVCGLSLGNTGFIGGLLSHLANRADGYSMGAREWSGVEWAVDYMQNEDPWD